MTSMKTKLRRKQGRKSNGPSFVQLFKYMLKSPAWLALSATAKAAYVQIALRYDGINNGTIALGVRTLAQELNCSRATAARALIELEDAGFIETAKLGSFTRKRMASEYRLTTFRCDLTGELPSKKFMRRQAQPTVSPRAPIVSPESHSPQNNSLQSHQRAYRADLAEAHSLTGETLIESHQGGSGSRAEREPEQTAAVVASR
jgi:DNA-binding MarR family transcriptional regulator